MSRRIRGAEATIRLTVDGQTVGGSMFRVTDFSRTPRHDLTETGFLGSKTDAIDQQFHGWDFSFTIQEEDEQALNLCEEIIAREQNGERPARLTLTVIYAFREDGATNKVETFPNCMIKFGETGFAGRKDYVTTKIEGKSEKRLLQDIA